MKAFRKLLATVLVVVSVFTLFLSLNLTGASAEIQVMHDYHYITPGEESSLMAIPKVFQVRTTITKFTSENNAPILKAPTDMFIDDDDNIYVLDIYDNKSGRVTKMDMWGNVLLEIVTVTCNECASLDKKCSHVKGSNTMKNPQGIYVFNDANGDPEADQHIYVADTDNSRILHFDQHGYYVECFERPDDPAIKDYPFDVKKLYINNQGTIYLTVKTDFQGMITLGTDGSYLGTTGMTWTVSSITDVVKNWFSSGDDPMDRMRLTAMPYTNFMMSDDGWMYATIDAEEKQIAKLNTSGANIYKDQQFGRNFVEVTDETTYTFEEFKSEFVDITVDDKGIIYALDENMGNIFMYDQDGNNLAFFGSLGTYRGRFQKPVAIGLLNDDSVVVLDRKTGYITIFSPTEFCQLMKEGTYLYFEAEYEKSRAIWTELLELDGNYVFAHKALGKAFFKEKKYDEAMAEYKLAKDTEGYSLSFEKKKGELTDKYFFLIVLVIVVALVVVVISYRAIKKYIDKLHVKITTWGGDE